MRGRAQADAAAAQGAVQQVVAQRRTLRAVAAPVVVVRVNRVGGSFAVAAMATAHVHEDRGAGVDRDVQRRIGRPDEIGAVGAVRAVMVMATGAIGAPVVVDDLGLHGPGRRRQRGKHRGRQQSRPEQGPGKPPAVPGARRCENVVICVQVPCVRTRQTPETVRLSYANDLICQDPDIAIRPDESTFSADE